MWNNRKDAGERSALRYLQAHGLELVLRNHRCRQGEIDLVMLDGRTLVLVEVRYRRTTTFGGAAASVDSRKQRRLIAAARHLLATHSELRKYPARFDVIALSRAAKGAVAIEWIKAAFAVES
jgi:putative endonuclease